MAVRFLNEALAGFKVDGVAMMTFVGLNLGAGQTGRTKRGARFGILATVILAEPIGIVVFWLAPQLITAFDSTPEGFVLARKKMARSEGTIIITISN